MSSFTMVMLEEGVEVVLPTDLTGIIAILDREVPYFSCEGHGYSITAGKATLGKRWDLTVKAIDYANRQRPPSPLGRIELEKVNNGEVRLTFPPRHEQQITDEQGWGPSGQIFGSFIYQTLNALQRHKLIDLPGVLPTI